MQLQFPRHLRYSPVNFLIVNWGFNGKAFDDCGLPCPEPIPCPEETPEVCCPIQLRDAIPAMGWATWLPEVIVGIEDPDEEIAASYVREAAIEFAKYTRVMQRQILIPIDPERCVYPLEPYAQENIIGVIAAGLDSSPASACQSACSGYLPGGVEYTLDLARNELHLEGCRPSCSAPCEVLRLLVWAAPTEDACEHDTFLYEMFRSDITAGARFRYAAQVHFRDNDLIRSLRALPDFEMAKAKAKGKATSSSPVNRVQGSGLWNHNLRCRGAF